MREDRVANQASERVSDRSEMAPLELGTRLQRRLVSPGVLNIQRLHDRYAPLQATTDRLWQRSSLPAATTSRYSVGVLPSGFAQWQVQRFQRQEVGGSANSEPIGQIQRSALSKPVSRFLGESSYAPGNPMADSRHQPAIAPPKPHLESAAISSDRSSSTRLFRISRQPAPFELSLPDPAANSQILERSAVEPAGSHAISPLPISDRTGPPSPMLSEDIPSQVEDADRGLATRQSNMQSNMPANPQTQETATLVVKPSPPAIQRRYHQSELVLPNRALVTEASLDRLPVAGTSLPIAQSPTVKHHYHQSELVMRSELPASEMSDRHPVVSGDREFAAVEAIAPQRMQPQSLQSIALVQRKAVTSDISGEMGRSGETIAQNGGAIAIGVDTSMPLAIGHSQSSVLVNRQVATTESTPAETIAATALPSASSSTPASAASSVDVAEIAEQVSRIISRRLIVERERRGTSI